MALQEAPILAPFGAQAISKVDRNGREVAMWWLMSTLAVAVEPPAAPAPPLVALEPAGAPLAIPVASEPPPPPLAIPGPPAPPPASRRDLLAMRDYQRQALAVRPISEVSVSPGTTTWSGWGGRWGGWGWATTTPPTVWRTDTWALFEGPHRLDVPTALDRLGDAAGADDLRRRIRGNRTAGTALQLVGGLGLAAAITGAVAADGASSDAAWAAWMNTAVIGAGAAAGGWIGGAFPLQRARRLTALPDRSLDRRVMEERVDAYNEHLATSLGLSPEAALQVDLDGARGRR